MPDPEPAPRSRAVWLPLRLAVSAFLCFGVWTYLHYLGTRFSVQRLRHWIEDGPFLAATFAMCGTAWMVWITWRPWPIRESGTFPRTMRGQFALAQLFALVVGTVLMNVIDVNMRGIVFCYMLGVANAALLLTVANRIQSALRAANAE